MKLLVIILNYKVTPLTIECLRSLSAEIPSIPSARVVVVENGSGDDADQQIRQAIEAYAWDSWVALTPLSHNLGFTGGNNLIIRRAIASADPPEYVLLLNADTVVPVGAIATLVRFMDEHPQAGIAGSRLEFPDGREQGSPFRFQGIASEFDRGIGVGLVSRVLSRWAACPPKPSSACPVDWVAGASMIVRRQVIEALGPLDEGFFTYFEDMDYCLNARRAGWSTWYVPQSIIIHYEGCSSGVGSGIGKRLPAFWFQARRRFFLKNYGAIYSAFADAAFIAGCALGNLRRRIERRPDTNPPNLLMDSIRHSVFLTGFQRDNRRMDRGGMSL